MVDTPASLPIQLVEIEQAYYRTASKVISYGNSRLELLERAYPVIQISDQESQSPSTATLRRARVMAI